MPEFVGPLGANSRHSRIASQCLLIMQAKRPSILIAQIGGALRLEGISHSQSRQNFAISQAVEWAVRSFPPLPSRMLMAPAEKSISFILSVTHSPTLSPAPYISSAIRRGTPAMCSKITFTSSRVNTTGTRWRRCTRLSPASSPNGICRTESYRNTSAFSA